MMKLFFLLLVGAVTRGMFLHISTECTTVKLHRNKFFFLVYVLPFDFDVLHAELALSRSFLLDLSLHESDEKRAGVHLCLLVIASQFKQVIRFVVNKSDWSI
jgi:hypothetical protein